MNITGLGTRNYYKILPKKFLPTSIDYPNKSKMHINLPARIAIIGASGSCKTNWLMNFIELVDVWDTITLYAKKLDEPLYAYLIDCLKESKISYKAFNTLENVIPCSKYDMKKNNLIIVDDFVNASAKELQPLADIWTMGRKNSITACFLSQSFFKIPQIIRQNVNYIIIFKIKNKGDLSRVISDNSLDIDLQHALKFLNWIRSLGSFNFLTIDKETQEADLKYRVNYDKTPARLYS